MELPAWHGENNVSLFSWLAFIFKGCHLHIYLTLVIYNETGVFVIEKISGACFWNWMDIFDVVVESETAGIAVKLWDFSFLTVSSLAALEFVKMSTSFAAIEDNFVKMMTFVFQSLAKCVIEHRLQKPYTGTMKAAVKFSGNKKCIS